MSAFRSYPESKTSPVTETRLRRERWRHPPPPAPTTRRMTIPQLNRLSREDFIGAVGFAFERSAWIASAAWERRPFRSIGDLHAAMVRVVEQTPQPEQVALIAAHPDLAGRLAREGRLTAASTVEQRSAGLDRLTPDESARFDALNAAYRERFAFPFVICAREHTKQTILAELESRTHNDRQTEIRTALGEIAKIARLRLETALGES